MTRTAPAPRDGDAARPAESRRRITDHRLSALLFTGVNLAVFLALFGCVIAAGYLFSQGY